MNKDFEKIIFTEKELQQHAQKIGNLIDDKYKEEDIVLIGLLKGAYVFTADIARTLKNPNVIVEFMVVSSYVDGKSTNELNVILDVKHPIKGKNVIVTEDIIDTGFTLSTIKKLLLDKGAKSVEIVAMFTKPSGRKIHVDIDYPSLIIPPKFVVGYGLDYNGTYRHLPYVASLTKEAIEKYKKRDSNE